MTSTPYSHAIRVIAAAAGFGAIAVVASMVLGIGAPNGETLIASLSVLVLALAFVLQKPAEDALGRRGGAVLAFALAGFVPCIALAAKAVLTAPIITTRWRCGTGFMMLLMILPFFVFFVGASSWIASAIALGKRRRFLDRAIDAAAIPCAGAALLVVCVAAGIALRSTSASHYVASLPVIGAVDASTVDAPVDQVVGDYVVRRQCEVSSCRVELRALGAPADPEAVNPQWLAGMDTAGFLVRRDAAHGFIILEARGEGLLAFDLKGVPVDVYPSDVAD